MEHQLATQLKQELKHHSVIHHQFMELQCLLARYQTCDVEQENRTLRDTLRALEAADVELKQLESRRPTVSLELSSVGVTVLTKLDPRSWFSSESAVADRMKAEALAEQRAFDTLIQAAAGRVTQLRHQAEQTKARINFYRTFDVLEAKAKVAALEQELSRLLPGLERLQERARKLDRILDELRQPLAGLEEQRRRLDRKIALAEEFEADLNSASSSQERAIIHQRCDSELNDASPGKAKRALLAHRRSIDRDIEKLQHRVQQEIERASYDIRELVIDGSNLCYRSGNVFIGLAALKAVVAALAGQYKITVVFDASMRKNLNMNSVDIESALAAAGVFTHIVASRQKADETILARAEDSDHTFVLSNDRYTDYPEKSAVRQNRVLRHEIIRDEVIIGALYLKVRY